MATVRALARGAGSTLATLAQILGAFVVFAVCQGFLHASAVPPVAVALAFVGGFVLAARLGGGPLSAPAVTVALGFATSVGSQWFIGPPSTTPFAPLRQWDLFRSTAFAAGPAIGISGVWSSGVAALRGGGTEGALALAAQASGGRRWD